MNRTITTKHFYTAVDITCPTCDATREQTCKIGDTLISWYAYKVHPERIAKATAMNRHPANRKNSVIEENRK